MRLGYFGGTFDPPHLGHLAVAQAAADAFSLERVLLVPTGMQPLRPVRPLAPYANRLAMVSLLCSHDARLHASDLEAPRQPPTPNYTIDTLQALRAAEADAELYVIVGADAFQSIGQWRSPELLLSVADWIVVTRPRMAGLVPASEQIVGLSPPQRGRIHTLQTVDHPASATAIRATLLGHDSAQEIDLGGMLPPEILTYIQQHGLYGAPVSFEGDNSRVD
jgi:nicotinate-nucleotide adenylyltransferase